MPSFYGDARMDPVLIFFAFIFSCTNTNKSTMNSPVEVTWEHISRWIEYNNRYLYIEASTATTYKEIRTVIKFCMLCTNCYCNTMYHYIAVMYCPLCMSSSCEFNFNAKCYIRGRFNK
jgi:hypothetical protein